MILINKAGKNICFFILFLIVYSIPALSGCAKNLRETKFIKGTASGRYTISNSDADSALETAVSNANRKIVKKILEDEFKRTGRKKLYTLLSGSFDKITPRLIDDYTVLEKKIKGDTILARVEASVDINAANDLVASLIEKYASLKILVLIKESFEGKLNEPGFTFSETIIEETLSNNGFEIIDLNRTRQLMKDEAATMKLAAAGTVSGDVKSLLLKDDFADILVIGTVQTFDQSHALREYTTMDMKSKSAIIRLKAIEIGSGRILASFSRNAPGIHTDSKTASRTAIKKCLGKILGKYDKKTLQFKTGLFINRLIANLVKLNMEREKKRKLRDVQIHVILRLIPGSTAKDIYLSLYG
ncbi:MAG: hypothetical protein GY754_13155 [bacterium]|nr:hypothetical protein [bacterium]